LTKISFVLISSSSDIFFIQKRTTLKISSAASTEGQENVLASLDLRWWQHIFVKDLHEQCVQIVICETIAVEVNGSRKILLYTQNSVLSVRTFKTCRRQFVIKMAVAMKISKAQYQKYKRIAICLHRLSFAHGQLYVTFRRSCSFDNAAVAVTEGHRQPAENDVKKRISRSASKMKIYKNILSLSVSLFVYAHYSHGYK